MEERIRLCSEKELKSLGFAHENRLYACPSELLGEVNLVPGGRSDRLEAAAWWPVVPTRLGLCPTAFRFGPESLGKVGNNLFKPFLKRTWLVIIYLNQQGHVIIWLGIRY